MLGTTLSQFSVEHFEKATLTYLQIENYFLQIVPGVLVVDTGESLVEIRCWGSGRCGRSGGGLGVGETEGAARGTIPEF